LIVGYSQKRANKDAYNREKGIKRLEKMYKSGSITKDKINNISTGSITNGAITSF